MMNFEKFHKVIKDRVENPNAFYYADPWWEKEIELFTENVQTTIAFLETECSDEELYWFGEVLEDVVQITQSRMLWKTFSKRAETVVDAEKKKSVIEDCITSEDFFTF